MFQAGSYNAGQRLGTFVYKGVQFGLIGVLAGLVGTTLTNSLLEARKRLNPNFVVRSRRLYLHFFIYDASFEYLETASASSRPSYSVHRIRPSRLTSAPYTPLKMSKSRIRIL